MNKRTNNDVFYHKLWGLMFPIVLQNLMLALVAVADAFMLGGMDLDDSAQRVERMKANFEDRPDTIYKGIMALLAGEVDYLLN